MRAPRQDVGCDEQFAHGQTGDAASPAEVVQHGIAEILLSATQFHHAAKQPALNLSECYNGMDECMRQVMRVANEFETWACRHVAFEALADVWRYLLEDRFGGACKSAMTPGEFAEFNEEDCLRVALLLGLPVKYAAGLPVPIDESATNPVTGSCFQAFRIQTVRDSLDDGNTEPFTVGDEPFDENVGTPYFGLHGVGSDGLREHIADRQTYAEAVSLAEKLAPGISFAAVATCPTFLPKRSGAR